MKTNIKKIKKVINNTHGKTQGICIQGIQYFSLGILKAFIKAMFFVSRKPQLFAWILKGIGYIGIFLFIWFVGLPFAVKYPLTTATLILTGIAARWICKHIL